MSPEAQERGKAVSLDASLRAAMKTSRTRTWKSITAAEHDLVAAQLRLTAAAVARDRRKVSELAMQNSKLALVFAALDPQKVEAAFLQIPMEELRGMIAGLRKVTGSTGWLKWSETRQGITRRFCEMLQVLKNAMSEQLQDTRRVRAAYKFLQIEAPHLGEVLAAWSDDALKIRPRLQSGGGLEWLHRIKKSFVTFLRVLHLLAVGALECVFYIPALVCKVVYPKDSPEDDRWKTSIFSWPYFANHVSGLDVLKALDPKFMHQYMGESKERAEVMESRFLHANRGHQFPSLEKYQRARQDWIAQHTSLYV